MLTEDLESKICRFVTSITYFARPRGWTRMNDLERNKLLASLSDSDRVVAVRELEKAATEVSAAAPSVTAHQQPLSELIPPHSSDEISALLQLGYTETQVCRREQRAYACRERERGKKRL